MIYFYCLEVEHEVEGTGMVRGTKNVVYKVSGFCNFDLEEWEEYQNSFTNRQMNMLMDLKSKVVNDIVAEKGLKYKNHVFIAFNQV